MLEYVEPKGKEKGHLLDQIVEPLSDFFADHNEKQRAWVRDHLAPESRKSYESLDGKLQLLDTILRSDWIQPTEAWKLQSLGIALGDALAQKLGLVWVTVKDEYGEDPALRRPGTSILIFPLTAISKRIERGATVNVYELVDLFCDEVQTRADTEERA